MKWSVVINAGEFDIPLFDSDSKLAARQYFKKIKLMSKRSNLKKTKKVRILKETFINVDLVESLSV